MNSCRVVSYGYLEIHLRAPHNAIRYLKIGTCPDLTFQVVRYAKTFLCKMDSTSLRKEDVNEEVDLCV